MSDHVFGHSALSLLSFKIPRFNSIRGNRSGYVEREREGSTGPSRGEHRLTVHRAHASRASIGLSKKCDFWTQK